MESPTFLLGGTIKQLANFQRAQPVLVPKRYLCSGPGTIFLHHHEDSGAIARSHVNIVLQDGWALENLLGVLLCRWSNAQWEHVVQICAVCD